MCLNSNGLKVRMFFVLEVNFSGDGDLKKDFAEERFE